MKTKSNEIDKLKSELKFLGDIANNLPFGEAEWAFVNERTMELTREIVHKRYGEEFVEFKLKFDADRKNNGADMKAISPQTLTSGYVQVGGSAASTGSSTP